MVYWEAMISDEEYDPVTPVTDDETESLLEQVEVKLWPAGMRTVPGVTPMATVVLQRPKYNPSWPKVIVWGSQLFVECGVGQIHYEEVTSAVAYTREQLAEMGVEGGTCRSALSSSAMRSERS